MPKNELPPAPSNTEWMADGACRETPNVNFLNPNNNFAIILAKKVCAECVVSNECLAYGLKRQKTRVLGVIPIRRVPVGIWGGKTRRERIQIYYGATELPESLKTNENEAEPENPPEEQI